MRYLKGVLIFVLLIALSTSATAGILMTTEQEHYVTARSGGKETAQKAYIEDDRMRVDTTREMKEHTIIFRADKDLFWVINHDEKTVMEITKEDLERMQQQMKSAMEQMENLPANQRKMMEGMMEGRMGNQKEIVYEKVDSGVNVGEWETDKYKGTIDGTLEQEVWTTSWSDLDLETEDFQVMKEMTSFFKDFSMNFDSSFFNVGSEDWEKGYAGVPVKTVSYSNGEKQFETLLKEIEEKALDASLFEKPENYTEKGMPQMGGGQY
jgi:hypothetical protein